VNLPVPVQRDAHGRLLPGFSGNPGGRTSGIGAVRELLRPNAPAFVTALVGLLQSPNETTRLAAIREFLDRLVGRPVQVVENDVRTLNMGEMYLAALKAVNAHASTVDVTPATDAPATVDATDDAAQPAC
jgi:hypothetical protein